MEEFCLKGLFIKLQNENAKDLLLIICIFFLIHSLQMSNQILETIARNMSVNLQFNVELS